MRLSVLSGTCGLGAMTGAVPVGLPRGALRIRSMPTVPVSAGSLLSLPSEKMNLPPPTFQLAFLLDAGAGACGESCCRGRVEAARPRDASSASSALSLPAHIPISGTKLSSLSRLFAVSCTPAAQPGWAWVTEGRIPLKTLPSAFGLPAD